VRQRIQAMNYYLIDWRLRFVIATENERKTFNHCCKSWSY
jgi:hypothetical protein